MQQLGLARRRYLVMFALLAVTLWSGLLSSRCLAVADTHPVASSSFLADDLFLSSAFGGEHLVCARPSANDGGGGGACGMFDWIDATAACPLAASDAAASPSGSGNATLADGLCRDVGEAPSGGFDSFDNLLSAILTLFVVTTLSGWSAPLWRVQRVTNSWLPLAIFTGVILCGSYLIINLLIAEMLTRFQVISRLLGS